MLLKYENALDGNQTIAIGQLAYQGLTLIISPACCYDFERINCHTALFVISIINY